MVIFDCYTRAAAADDEMQGVLGCCCSRQRPVICISVVLYIHTHVCFHGVLLQDCCQPVLDGAAVARSAPEVVRARITAALLGKAAWQPNSSLCTNCQQHHLH